MVSHESNAGIQIPPDLDTPALVVDAERLDANISRMAGRAAAAGIALWPHAKTHKCLPIAQRQLEGGAAGLTVATMDEAEQFAEGGCHDLFIAYPVWAGHDRAARLHDLHDRVCLRVGVDNLESAEVLSAALRGVPRALDVLLEIDSGGHRTGVQPAAVRELAEGCLRLGLNVVGAFTHPGHAYAGLGSVARAAEDEQRVLQDAGEWLEPLLGFPPALSGGSTPTTSAVLAGAMTEVRPGTYVFGDRQQMNLSNLPEQDVALVVASRVVSTPRPGEAVLDAGSKTLSSDRPKWLEGHGWLPDAPEARIAALSEEHAVVTGLTRPLHVGDLVAVIPNHVCTSVNLSSQLLVVSDGTVVDAWPVRSRVARPYVGHPSGHAQIAPLSR